MNNFSLLLCTLFAFAANSVICRIALDESLIDANSFTIIRLVSGALILALIVCLPGKTKTWLRYSTGSWWASICLFIYALAFSHAYIRLDSGTGALILFGTVQITMIMVSMIRGKKLKLGEFFGVVIAFSGMTYLVIPSITTPSLTGFILMILAGGAWGAYSLLGQASQYPLADTAYNFIRTMPLVVILIAFILVTDNTEHQIIISQSGVIYAILSGAIASGLGYALWYKILPKLDSSVAAVSQLFVPTLAAAGGWVFLAESLSLRLALATVLVLGGIYTVIYTRQTE